MLSRSFESAVDEEVNYLHEAPELRRSVNPKSVQDNVERLLDIAGELFSAIECQIHRIEEELVFSGGEDVRRYAQTIFKERLIRCTESLNLSIQEISLNVERQALQHIDTYGLRDSN
jgi:hypothetical protein